MVVFVAIGVDLDVDAGVNVNVICFRLDGITSTVWDGLPLFDRVRIDVCSLDVRWFSLSLSSIDFSTLEGWDVFFAVEAAFVGFIKLLSSVLNFCHDLSIKNKLNLS